MSRITIKEADLTRVTASNLGTEIVYIPGFATVDPNYISSATAVEAGVPTLCSSVAELEAYFGSIPAVFAEAQEYPDNFDANAVPESGVMFDALSVDPSYVYARELLTAGIPVLYERINEGADDITVAKMYEALLSNTTTFSNLSDTGEYSVKYITTGGYPVFEYGDSSAVDYTVGNLALTHTGAEPYEVRWKQTPTANAGKDTFLTMAPLPESGSATNAFTYSDGVWTLESTASQDQTTVYDLREYGILETGTPSSGDTITVTVTAATVDEPKPVLVQKMITTAATRGDCVAIIDHTNNPDRSLVPMDATSVYYAVSDRSSAYRINTNGEYAAMFTPWCSFTYSNLASAVRDTTFSTGDEPVSVGPLMASSSVTINYNDVKWAPAAMPASFAYLMSLAMSVRHNASWLAIAGVSRGVVPNFVSLYTNERMTNAIAEAYQKETAVSINPITNIKPYGFTIWGNRTLKDNSLEGGLTALSFLNIRNMVSDVKKQAYTAAKRCLFEQNTDILWLNFKSYVTPLLDQMTTGYGLSGYKIMREASQDPSKVIATIRLYPIYAVESFDITIELSNESISVE